jgi:hypothetical protein
MREPKFSDAWCFGKEFQANSKICRVCLANKQCQTKFYKGLGATRPLGVALLAPIKGSAKLDQGFRRAVNS